MSAKRKNGDNDGETVCDLEQWVVAPTPYLFPMSMLLDTS